MFARFRYPLTAVYLASPSRLESVESELILVSTQLRYDTRSASHHPYLLSHLEIIAA